MSRRAVASSSTATISAGGPEASAPNTRNRRSTTAEACTQEDAVHESSTNARGNVRGNATNGNALPLQLQPLPPDAPRGRIRRRTTPYNNATEANAVFAKKLQRILNQLSQLAYLCRANYVLAATNCVGAPTVRTSREFAFLNSSYLSPSVVREMHAVALRPTINAVPSPIYLQALTEHADLNTVLCLLNTLGDAMLRSLLVNLLRILKKRLGTYSYTGAGRKPGKMRKFEKLMTLIHFFSAPEVPLEDLRRAMDNLPNCGYEASATLSEILVTLTSIPRQNLPTQLRSAIAKAGGDAAIIEKVVPSDVAGFQQSRYAPLSGRFSSEAQLLGQNMILRQRPAANGTRPNRTAAVTGSGDSASSSSAFPSTGASESSSSIGNDARARPVASAPPAPATASPGMTTPQLEVDNAAHVFASHSGSHQPNVQAAHPSVHGQRDLAYSMMQQPSSGVIGMMSGPQIATNGHQGRVSSSINPMFNPYPDIVMDGPPGVVSFGMDYAGVYPNRPFMQQYQHEEYPENRSRTSHLPPPVRPSDFTFAPPQGPHSFGSGLQHSNPVAPPVTAHNTIAGVRFNSGTRGRGSRRGANSRRGRISRTNTGRTGRSRRPVDYEDDQDEAEEHDQDEAEEEEEDDQEEEETGSDSDGDDDDESDSPSATGDALNFRKREKEFLARHPDDDEESEPMNAAREMARAQRNKRSADANSQLTSPPARRTRSKKR